MEIDKGSFKEEVILGKVQILGLQQQVSRMFLNENEISFKYDVFTSVSISFDTDKHLKINAI